jgi:hypothetical protein
METKKLCWNLKKCKIFFVFMFLFLYLLCNKILLTCHAFVRTSVRLWGARWSSGRCARRAIAEAKHRCQWPVIGWVTKINYLELLRASAGTLSRWSRLHLQSLAPTSVSWRVDVRRPVVKINAESLSQHDEKHVVPTLLSGIRVGGRAFVRTFVTFDMTLTRFHFSERLSSLLFYSVSWNNNFMEKLRKWITYVQEHVTLYTFSSILALMPLK